MLPGVQIEVCGGLIYLLLYPVGDSKSINWDERFTLTKAVFYIPLLQPYLQFISNPEFNSRLYSSSEGKIIISLESNINNTNIY